MAKEKKEEEKKEIKSNGLLEKKLAAQAKLIKKMKASGCVATELKPPDFYPTGLPVFDKEVLGIGGLPKGRIIEVYGPKSSGKSALSYYLAGHVQTLDPSAVVKIYDREHSCTSAWLKSMGLDLARTIIIGSPDKELSEDAKSLSAEEMAEMIHADLALAELAPSIIIIDSIAVIQTESVMETAIEDRTMRDNLDRAAFLTKFFDGLTDGFYYPAADKNGKLPDGSTLLSISNTNTCLICVNHAKQKTVKVGARTMQEWYSVGGVSLDFHAVLQLMVTRRGFEKGSDGNVSHQKVHVCADKNKIAPPKRECELLLSFQGGMEQIGTIDWLTIAITKGLAEKNGAWIESRVLLKDDKIQGIENFNKYIEEHEEARKLLID